MTEVNIFIAFGAGFLSFVSPCVLPLFPAFLSYITGMSVREINEDNKKLTKKSMMHTVLFLLGFSSVFIMIGFSPTLIADFFMMYQDIIRQIGAVLIIFFGLVIIGLLNFQFLMKDKKLTFTNRPAVFIGSFFVRLASYMRWT